MKSFEKIGGKILAGILSFAALISPLSPAAGAMERIDDVFANAMNIMSSPKPTTGRCTYTVHHNLAGCSVVYVFDYDNHTVNISSSYISTPSSRAFGLANGMNNVGLRDFLPVFVFMFNESSFTDTAPLMSLKQQLATCSECDSYCSVTYDFARGKFIVQVTGPFSFSCELDMIPSIVGYFEHTFMSILPKNLELKSGVEIVRH